MSPKDRQLDEYQNLVLLCRALWRQGFCDLLPGQISVRQDHGNLLVASTLRRWDQMRVLDVSLHSANGTPLDGSQQQGGVAAIRALHAKRPGAVWVGLLRSRAVAYWSCTERVPRAYDELAALSGGIERVPVSRLDDTESLSESLGGLPDPLPILLFDGLGALLAAQTLEQFASRAVALEVRARTAIDLEGVLDARELKLDRERQIFSALDGESPGLWPALVNTELQNDSAFLD